MSERNATFYTDGTSALNMGLACPQTRQARIIKFEQRNRVQDGELPVKCSMAEKPSNDFTGYIRRILESSEMYCSLKLESFLGCPYRVLSPQNVTCIAVGSTIIGMISLILGS